MSKGHDPYNYTPKETQVEKLVSAMKRGWMSPARAASRFAIYSGYHRRLTDVREAGYKLISRDTHIRDKRGKVITWFREHRIAS